MMCLQATAGGRTSWFLRTIISKVAKPVAGYMRTAQYVAGEFARLGLVPAGTEGYFQPVPFISRVIDPVDSHITLLTEIGPEPLVLGREVIIGLQVDPPSLIEAELVFAGYGLSIPEEQYDDFADLDVRGKLVIFLGYTALIVRHRAHAHRVQSPAERAALLRQALSVRSGYWHSDDPDREWACAAQTSSTVSDACMIDERRSRAETLPLRQSQVRRWISRGLRALT